MSPMIASRDLGCVAPPREVAARELARPAALLLLACVALVIVMRLAVRASIGAALASILAPALVVGAAVAAFRVLQAMGAVSARPLRSRHGLLVVAIGACVALPMLGSFSLVDPWETHYAEVSREMLERHDFVSPWWANEGWFMTKPVLTFWLEAGAMALFGVRTGPNELLAGAAHPEWAVRFPAFALALAGAYLLYHGVSRTCGRRAGLLGAIALFSMPGFAMLSRQALTDMPLVACVAASLGLLLRAMSEPEAAEVKRFSLRAFGRSRRAIVVHAGHALAALAGVALVPQLAMLALANVHGRDHVIAGSPHACGLPGQPACVASAYAHPALQPAVVALLFAPIAAWLLVRLATETRKARLFALAAWTCAAVATMAKGPAGLAVPAGAIVVAIAAQRSLRPLLRLEIATGVVLAGALIAPWYLAVYARHGRGFLDELVMRNMLGRTLDHLHDTNAGEDVGLTYFVKQLGYATFPWCGVAAAALLSESGRAREDGSRRGAARTLLFGATILAFALVSSMRTKFHHYGLIVVPPVAMLAGLWLDARLGEAKAGGDARARSTALAAIGAASVVLLVTRDFASPKRLMELMTYRYDRLWPATAPLATALFVFGALAALATFALASRRARAAAAIGLAVVGLASSVFVLDFYLPWTAPDGGQREVILAYERARANDAPSSPRRAPLVAYQLNWKGENFYTGNDLAIFIASGPPMKTWLDARRAAGDTRFYFVTETRRVSPLRGELQSDGYPLRTFETLTGSLESAEYRLVRADLE